MAAALVSGLDVLFPVWPVKLQMHSGPDMSYDLSIYFPHVVFPAKGWEEILAFFAGPDCELNASCPSSAAAGLKHGSLRVGGWSLVSIRIASLKDDLESCAPPGSRWVADIGTGLGSALQAKWIQFAIPYHALVLIPAGALPCLTVSMDRALRLPRVGWNSRAAACGIAGEAPCI